MLERNEVINECVGEICMGFDENDVGCVLFGRWETLKVPFRELGLLAALGEKYAKRVHLHLVLPFFTIKIE